MEKDVQFAFRVEASLREQFVRSCKSIGRPAGQVLREFMRGFIGEQMQPSLFGESTTEDIRAQNRNRQES